MNFQLIKQPKNLTLAKDYRDREYWALSCLEN